MKQKFYFYQTFASFVCVLQLISILFISLKTCSVFANNDMKESSNWNTIFSLRSDDDWRQLWHTEKHKRCYQDLVDHMEWVCDKDIYKLKHQKRFERQLTDGSLIRYLLNRIKNYINPNRNVVIGAFSFRQRSSHVWHSS